MNNEWREYRKLVIYELKRLAGVDKEQQEQMDDLEVKLIAVEKDVAAEKIKNSVITGIIAVVITLLIEGLINYLAK